MDFILLDNATVPSIDRVPEPFRGFYTQGDGGYVLNDSFKPTALAVDGLNKSLKAARRDADEAKRNKPDLSGFAQIGQLFGLEGDDAMSADALKSAAEKLLTETKDGKVNWEKMKASLESGFKQQITAKDADLATMAGSLQKYLVDNAALSVITAHKGSATLLLPHIRAKTKVIKTGEDYEVRVVDEAGDVRGNTSGGFMTVEDLVKELKASADFGRAFESEAPAGNGLKPNQQQRHNPAPQQGELSATQKIQAGLKNRNK
jgi:hypothetical protein